MGGRTEQGRNARSLKAFSFLLLALMAASLVLVHTASYEPAVSYILLYLVSSLGIITTGVVVPLLPVVQFTAGFCGSIYALYAAVVAMMVFFSGGTSSELYVMFFALLPASALHGSWRVVLAVLAAVLFCYTLAMLPDLLEGGTVKEIASLVFYRLAAVGLSGLFLTYLARGVLPATLAEDYATDEDGSLLLERVEEELATHRGVSVAVVLVDPGGDMEAMDLLLERVWARIGEPVLLGEGNLFGVVLSGVDDGGVESAARPGRRERPRRAGHQGGGRHLSARRPLPGGPLDRRRTGARGRFRGRVVQRHRPRQQGHAAGKPNGSLPSSTLRLTPPLVSESARSG